MNTNELMLKIVSTNSDFVLTFVRLIGGIIIFPYGAQKLFGVFDDFGGGVGIKASLESFARKKVPVVIAWMVILGQALGSIFLILGFVGRLAAISNIIIFTGALISHFPDGWVLNWTGKKNGEGIEYFVLLLSFLLITAIQGSGALSIDNWIIGYL